MWLKTNILFPLTQKEKSPLRNTGLSNKSVKIRLLFPFGDTGLSYGSILYDLIIITHSCQCLSFWFLLSCTLHCNHWALFCLISPHIINNLIIASKYTHLCLPLLHEIGYLCVNLFYSCIAKPTAGWWALAAGTHTCRRWKWDSNRINLESLKTTHGQMVSS